MRDIHFKFYGGTAVMRGDIELMGGPPRLQIFLKKFKSIQKIIQSWNVKCKMMDLVAEKLSNAIALD